MRYSTVSTLALALALTAIPAAFAQNASQGQQPAATTGNLRPAQQQVNPADPYSDDADAGSDMQFRRLKAILGMDPATTSAVPADDAAMQEDQPAEVEEEPAAQ